jgi:hypothetical protein
MVRMACLPSYLCCVLLLVHVCASARPKWFGPGGAFGASWPKSYGLCVGGTGEIPAGVSGTNAAALLGVVLPP